MFYILFLVFWRASFRACAQCWGIFSAAVKLRAQAVMSSLHVTFAGSYFAYDAHLLSAWTIGCLYLISSVIYFIVYDH